ncbi:hypothetical protein [uncultured Tateyamaria sp.]|uniref:hypothetical protein n=1 Tax=Tateyamaria sp. 1078 TaxID=3417464 RepID=UPI0026235B08|nr:hypothetical protein [uncultured Tateyamaria sp.]
MAALTETPKTAAMRGIYDKNSQNVALSSLITTEKTLKAGPRALIFSGDAGGNPRRAVSAACFAIFLEVSHG